MSGNSPDRQYETNLARRLRARAETVGRMQREEL